MTAPVRAMGVASPGPLNPFTGIVMAAPNLGWRNVPLRDELRKALNLPVEINNDCNLAAMGEQKYGAARGKKDVAYVTLSTGIGCGVILNNQLVLGARGQATELGHMSVEFNSSMNYQRPTRRAGGLGRRASHCGAGAAQIARGPTFAHARTRRRRNQQSDGQRGGRGGATQVMR